MEKEKLEKVLSITKKGYPVMWVTTQRFTSPTSRFGESSAICTPNGKLARIMRTNQYYTKVKNLVKIDKDSIYIQSIYNIDGCTVSIYKISDIDLENKKVILEKIATRKDGKWDNSEYFKKYKEGIHSTSMRAKKFYSLMDLS